MKKFTRKQDAHFYIQWKPSDWITDPGLRRCSAAAKGVWMDMLMAMFYEETRGVLPGDLKLLQRLLPHDEETIRLALHELLEHGVVSYGMELDTTLGEHDLVNRRMYRENYIARIRSEAGKLGGRPRKSVAPEADAYAENPEKQTQSKSETNQKQNPKQIEKQNYDSQNRVSPNKNGAIYNFPNSGKKANEMQYEKQNESPITIARAITKEKYINAEDPKAEDPRTEYPRTEGPGPYARGAILTEGANPSLSAEQPFVENISADSHLVEDQPVENPETDHVPREEVAARQQARLPKVGQAVADQAAHTPPRGNAVGFGTPGNHSAPGGCTQAGDLLPIGGIFGGLTALDSLLVRVYAVGKDGEKWQQWWRKALSAIQKDPDGWCYFVDLLCYVEDCVNPKVRAAKDLGVLKSPGKYLVSKLLSWARHHQVRIPALPREVAA